MKKRDKKALSHVEFMLSFLIFVVFITILFIILNPFKIEKRDISIESTENILNEYLQTYLTTVSFYTDDSISSDSDCFYINKINNGNVIVKKQGIGLIPASSNSVINIKDDGGLNSFYKISLSEDFIENGPTSCVSSLDGKFGVPVTRKIYSLKKIDQLKLDYISDYLEVKQRLNLNYDFKLSITIKSEPVEIVDMDREVPEGVSVIAREKPIQVLEYDGEIYMGKLNLMVW